MPSRSFSVLALLSDWYSASDLTEVVGVANAKLERTLHQCFEHTLVGPCIAGSDCKLDLYWVRSMGRFRRSDVPSWFRHLLPEIETKGCLAPRCGAVDSTVHGDALKSSDGRVYIACYSIGEGYSFKHDDETLAAVWKNSCRRVMRHPLRSNLGIPKETLSAVAHSPHLGMTALRTYILFSTITCERP